MMKKYDAYKAVSYTHLDVYKRQVEEVVPKLIKYYKKNSK